MVSRKDVAHVALTALAFSLLFVVAVDISSYKMPLFGYGIAFIILLFISTAMMLQGWLRYIATIQGWSFVGTMLGTFSLIYSIWLTLPTVSGPTASVLLLPIEPIIYAVVGILILFTTLALLLEK